MFKLSDLLSFVQHFNGVPVLIYHSIGGSYPDALSVQLFNKHIDFFDKNGYNIISLYALLNILKGAEKIKYPAACITFDDGYSDFFDTAYPILKKYNYPATLFMTVNMIGQAGYLSLVQLKELLRDSLISVGSHTMSHCDLPSLEVASARREMHDSKKILEGYLGCSVDLFAYPWGIFSGSMQGLLKEEGYSAAFTTNSRLKVVIKNNNPYSIPRITMSQKDSYPRFLAKVSGFAYFFARNIKNGRKNG